MMAMVWCAVRAVEYLYVTPIYLTLGIKISDIGFVWVAGNAGIFLLTPFLGAVSDFSEHPCKKWHLKAAVREGRCCGLISFIAHDDGGGGDHLCCLSVCLACACRVVLVSGGKRRPFIFWAVLAALLGALTFPNAEYIGYWLGDRRGFQPCGIATAVLSLVVSAPGSKG